MCTIYSDSQLHGINALEYSRCGAIAALFAEGLREHAGAVRSISARLERHHTTRLAFRQTQRAGRAAGGGHPHVRATRYRNTRIVQRTQLTTVSTLYISYIIIYTIEY